MQIAETQRQCPLLLWRNHLLPQKHHPVAQYRMIKLFKLIIAQRTRQIRTSDLCANVRPQRVMLRRSLIVLSPCRASGDAEARADPVLK